MSNQRGFGDNGTESARPCQSGQGDDHMNEQGEEVAPSGNLINTSNHGIAAIFVIRHAQAFAAIDLQPRRQ